MQGFPEPYEYELSVIFSCFNVAESVVDAFEEVLAALEHASTTVEFIFVDDCSTDETLLVLDGFARTNTDVVVIRHKVNQGVAGTVRSGVQAARGKFCLLVPGDAAMARTTLDPILQVFSSVDFEDDAVIGFERSRRRFYSRNRGRLRSLASDLARLPLILVNRGRSVPRYRAILARTELLDLVPTKVERYGHGTGTVATILLSKAQVIWVSIRTTEEYETKSKLQPALVSDYLKSYRAVLKSRKSISRYRDPLASHRVG